MAKGWRAGSASGPAAVHAGPCGPTSRRPERPVAPGPRRGLSSSPVGGRPGALDRLSEERTADPSPKPPGPPGYSPAVARPEARERLRKARAADRVRTRFGSPGRSRAGAEVRDEGSPAVPIPIPLPSCRSRRGWDGPGRRGRFDPAPGTYRRTRRGDHERRGLRPCRGWPRCTREPFGRRRWSRESAATTPESMLRGRRPRSG